MLEQVNQKKLVYILLGVKRKVTLELLMTRSSIGVIISIVMVVRQR